MKPAEVVLIEDNPADVLLVQMALEENGIEYALTQFESGEQVVRVLDAEIKCDLVPDSILLDLNTPGTDGFEALRRLLNFPRLSRVPIAILTSSRHRENKHRAATARALDSETTAAQ